MIELIDRMEHIGAVKSHIYKPLEMKDGEYTKVMIDGKIFVLSNNGHSSKRNIKGNSKKLDKGNRIATVQNNAIYENILRDITRLLVDGEKHDKNEINELIIMYYPYGKKGGINSKSSAYLKFLRDKKGNLLRDETIPNKHTKKRYWIENRVIREKARKTDRIVWSDGTRPLTNMSDKDRRFM